jgi:hypothetical protein
MQHQGLPTPKTHTHKGDRATPSPSPAA